MNANLTRRKFKNTVQRMIDNKEITFHWDGAERSSGPTKKARRTKNGGSDTIDSDVQGFITKGGYMKVTNGDF
eukprot:5922974-Ditylum_brightwellii.AAC.1